LNNRHWFKTAFGANKNLYSKVILASVMINLLSVASSIFIMVVYDRVIPNAAYSSLFALTIGMTIVVIFDFILKNLRSWFIDLAGQDLDLSVGEDIYNRILNAPMDKLNSSVGNLANTFKEFDSLKEFFTSATIALIVDLPFVFLFILVIYLISGPLAIIPLSTVPIILIIGIVIQPFIARYSESLSQMNQSKYSLMIESLGAIDAIQTNDSSPLFIERYRSSVKEGSNASRKSKVLSQLATNSASSAQLISLVGIIFYGTYLIDAGTVSMGAMVAAVLLSSRALAPMAQVANLFGRLNTARTAYKKIDQLLLSIKTQSKEDDGIIIQELGDLELRNLSFSYFDSNTQSLSQINLVIKKGERVAIMGRNGSGKTTLIKLLSGLYMPTQGSLTYNKLPIEQINKNIYRKKLAVVLQDFQLFSGSIKDNIVMGREWIEESEIEIALESSGTKSFLHMIPGGIESKLSDRGQSLSTGQRQSIALARALVGRPEILVLDESTSSLDLNAEKDFLNTLDIDMFKTLILVTHRLPMLDLVNRIIVLADGKIAMDGDKEDILNQLRS
jgi:ATP-binding cassette, subfamily C, bacterial LapB